MEQSSNTYVAIDIGETFSKLVVGTNNNGNFELVGLFNCETKGFTKGEITSVKDLQRTIITLLEKARKVDIEITKVILTLPSYNLSIRRKEALLHVGKKRGTYGVVNEEDFRDLINGVAGHQLLSDEMPIAVYPIEYILDGESYQEKPIGIKGNELIFKAYVATAPKSIAKTIADAFYELNLSIIDVIPSPVALSYAIARKEERKNGIVIAEVGVNYTGVSVIYRNLICNYSQSKLGSKLIDEDIANNLNVDITTARALKEKYGGAYASEAVDLAVCTNPVTDQDISEKQIAEICEKRIKDIALSFYKCYDSMLKEQKYPLLLTGGIANTYHIAKKVSEVLNIKTSTRLLEIVGGSNAIYFPAIGSIIKVISEENDVEVDVING